MTNPNPHSPRRKTLRRIGAAAVALTLAATLAACSATSSAGTGSAKRVDGGDITVYSSKISTLDPRQNHGVINRALTDSLIDIDPKTLEPKPWLATKWSIDDDQKNFTFTLKQGVTFSDGSALTPAVVKTNIDQAAKQIDDGKGWYIQGLFDNYTDTTVDGDDTVTVHFSKPAPAFLNTLGTSQLAILGTASFKNSYEDRATGKFVGSGPFVLQSYTPNEGAVITRRSGYDWASGAAKHTGEASLEKVTFKFVDEQSVRESALQSGEADLAQNPTTEVADTLKSSGYGISSRAQVGIPYSLVFNYQTKALQDLAVRRAISDSIDRKSIVKSITGSREPVATSIISRSTPGYADESKYLQYDLAAAKQELDDAGWKVGSDGVREKDGEKLSLSLVNWWEPQTVKDTLVLLKEQLAKAGIDLTIKNEIGGGTTYQDGKGDILLNNATRADGGLALYSQYAGDNFSTASSITDATFPNIDSLTEPGSDLSKIVTDQITEPDADKRDAELAKAQEILVRDAIRVPIYVNQNTEDGYFASSAKVHGLSNDSLSELWLYDAWTTA